MNKSLRTIFVYLVMAIILAALSGFTLPSRQSKKIAVPEVHLAVQNSSFEEMDGSLPKGWKTRTWQPKAVFEVDSTVAHSGKNSLKISSAEGADASWMTVVPLKPEVLVDARKTLHPMSKYIYGQFIEHLGRSIYQGIWAEMLEDRKFYYAVGSPDSPWKPLGEPHSVWMNPVVAYVGVHAPEVRLKGDGRPGGIAQEGLALIQEKKYVGRVVLAGDPGVSPLNVRLRWGPGAEDRQTISIADVKSDYSTFPLSFTAGATAENARLEVWSNGGEAFRVGTVSLMPADHVEGFRPEVLALLKELDSPVYRWPGGNFVSGYNWKDGVGDPDRRPPRKNPAWQGIEHNDVGIHEFLAFCKLIGTEPYITVNSGQGDERLAADEVEYVNGAAGTPMGEWRARNGRPEPWGVKWWSIGNEMYGDWQLGHMPLQDYVKKHNRLARAMLAKDPAIKLVGVGAVGAWS